MSENNLYHIVCRDCPKEELLEDGRRAGDELTVHTAETEHRMAVAPVAAPVKADGGVLLRRVTVRVDQDDLDRLDELVEAGVEVNRSEAVRDAISEYIGKRESLLTDGGER